MAIKIPKQSARPVKRATAASKPAPASYAHVAIDDQDVVLLQLRDNGRVNIQDIAFAVFEAKAPGRRAGATWFAFHASGKPHHGGKSTWLGLSNSVPLEVLDMLQAVLQAAGMDVERDTGRALRLQLDPLARLSDDGLEILVPAALVGEPGQRRVIDRGGTPAIARGYTLAPSNAAALQDLLLGR